MMKIKLTKEEKELAGSFGKGEWKSIPDGKDETQRYQKYARTQLQKDKRVNIRLSSMDLQGLQRRALEEGIPYQTLMASILHKFVSGILIERRAT
jgi:predicted DNA binding CopG/RHH family protein